jgi:hypothetical protein
MLLHILYIGYNSNNLHQRIVSRWTEHKKKQQSIYPTALLYDMYMNYIFDKIIATSLSIRGTGTMR